MKRFFSVWGLMMMAAWLVGCGSSKKIAALKPEANYSTDLVYDKQTSYLNLPIDIAVVDLQNQTNKYLNGLIYDDNQIEGDNLMLKVWKQAPIILNENGGKIDIILPLKVWAKYRYGIQQFGISAFDTKEFNLTGNIKLTTQIAFKNWKLSTNTQIQGIDWIESPSVSILGKDIPITGLINPAVSLFKGKVSKLIDDAIMQSLDIKPYILNALDQVSKPVEVNKDYHVWFAMQPVELYTNQAVIANKKISVSLGMKAYLETSVNSKPTLSFDKTKLVLSAIDKPSSDFGISVAGIITYQAAAELMQKNFNGQTFQSGGKSITVTSVNLWGKDGKMIVELGMQGSVNGNFYLAGVPMFNQATKEVYLDKVEFVLDSKNKLLKVGDWLAHGVILKKLEASCRYSLATQLDQASVTLKKFLTNYEPIKGVKVNGRIDSFSPQQLTLTPNAIVTMINAKGGVAVNVNGMQ